MYYAENENDIIVDDVVQALLDHVGIQPDINDQKIKASWLASQRLNVTKIVGRSVIDRCLNPETPEDKELKRLLIPALANYTYSRCLSRFQGTLTDSGYHIDKEATDKNVAKSTSLDFFADADTYMEDVIEFLNKENPEGEAEARAKLAPQIRVIGGGERRASN